MDQFYILEILTDDPALGLSPIDVVVGGTNLDEAKAVGKSLLATHAVEGEAQVVRVLDQNNNEVWRWDGGIETTLCAPEKGQLV